MSFELLPLDCPSCGSSVRARGGDVVYYCISCRNGYQLDAEGRGLAPVEVAFVAAANVAVERYLPFWHLPATIEIRQRVGSGGGFGGLINAFASAFSGPQTPARAEAAFVIPAFRAQLGSVTELAKRYTLAYPSLGEKLGERLVGGRYGADDARKLAHYALIASEVEKRDVLRQLEYGLEFGTERLLGVPFVRDGDGWRDALYGVPAHRLEI